MKKQLLDELNLRLAAMENEITTLQNQITILSEPTCTDSELAQMKMLISKFPLSNLKHAQYLHATQLQVANLFEQLEHEKNLRRQQDRVIQQLQIVVEDLQKKTKTSTVEQPVNTPLPTPPPTEPESTDTQRRLAELKPLKRLTIIVRRLRGFSSASRRCVSVDSGSVGGGVGRGIFTGCSTVDVFVFF